MCAKPSEEQLKVEVPTTQRPTRATQQKYAAKNNEVVKVVVFKGASGKPAVIRAVTYDLLFNNMKSIVTKTSGERPVITYTCHTYISCMHMTDTVHNTTHTYMINNNNIQR